MTAADAAIARRSFRQLARGATLCALGFGVTAAASAVTYVSSFPTAAGRHQLALTTGNDAGLSVLLGPVSSIDTVGGYMFYKGFVFLTTVGAIWALLATTRLLRGEEDTGRWQLLMAGRTRPARATAAVLGALAAAVGVIFVGTTVLTLLAARKPGVELGTGAVVLFGASLAVAPVSFGALGAFTSQLAGSRRGANGLGMIVFAAAFVLRMVADSGASAHWLRWATPFGWTELTRPFTGADAWPLLAAAGASLGLGIGAVALASRRDVGDGVLASRDVAALRPFGLRSGFGLSARLELPVLAAWCAGALASGLALGMIAKMTTAATTPSLRHTLDKFGVHGSFADQYLGVAFLLVATLVALLPASQVGAAAEEEASGRLVHVVTGTTRLAWFAGRLVIAATAVIVAGLLGGFGAWLGAVSQGVPVSAATMVGSGLNVVPTGVLTLGVGAVTLAAAPRIASTSVFLVVTWSLLVDILASTVSGLGAVDRLSLFHYLALSPAQPVRLTTVAVTTMAGVLLCIGATAWFCRRDLQPD